MARPRAIGRDLTTTRQSCGTCTISPRSNGGRFGAALCRTRACRGRGGVGRGGSGPLLPIRRRCSLTCCGGLKPIPYGRGNSRPSAVRNLASQTQSAPAYSALMRCPAASFSNFLICSNGFSRIVISLNGIDLFELVLHRTERMFATLQSRQPSAPLRAPMACAMAPRAAGVSASALSITKSWIVPLYRIDVTRTPASDSLRA